MNTFLTTVEDLVTKYDWVENSDGSIPSYLWFIEITMLVNIVFGSLVLLLFFWLVNRQTHIRKTKGSLVVRRDLVVKAAEEEKDTKKRRSMKLARKRLQEFTIEMDEDDILEENHLETGEEKKMKTMSTTSSMSKERKFLFDVMNKVKLFSYLSEQAQMEIVKKIEYVNLKKGDYLFDYNTKKFDGSFYAVVSGNVKVTFHDFLVGQNDNLQHNHHEPGEGGFGDSPVSTYYEKGAIVTPPLGMLMGLIEYMESQKKLSVSKNQKKILEDAGNISASAVEVETCVIRIAPKCFAGILEKYPAEVYRLVQALLFRIQRVTMITLFKMLGLQTEVFKWIGSNNGGLESRTSEQKQNSFNFFQDIMINGHSETNCSDDSIKKKSCEIAAEQLGIPMTGEGMNLLLEFAKIEEYSDGTCIIQSGKEHDNAYLLLSGSMKFGIDLPQHRKHGVFKFEDVCTVSPGTLVGVMSSFSSEISLYTVQCHGPCTVMVIPNANFASIMSEYPISMAKCLRSLLSMLSPIICFLNWNSDWIHVDGGDRIVNKGDRCDSLFIVLNGRLRATYGKSKSGLDSIVEELGRGKYIGELGGPSEVYLCDVDAIRHSEFVKIPILTLIAIIRSCPCAGVSFARLITSKVQAKLRAQLGKENEHYSIENRSLQSHGLSLSTIAVVPLTSKIQLSSFCSVLFSELNQIVPTKLVTKKEARSEVGEAVCHNRGSMFDILMTRYLADLEENNRVVVYQADSRYTWWSKLCVQQSDLILLVVDKNEAPGKELIDDCLKLAHKATGVKVQLVVIKNEDTASKTNHLIDENYDNDEEITASDELNNWSEERPWITGYHMIRVPFDQHKLDFYRMCRRMTGLSVGLVLGGGGARGLAHLGVIRALSEAGIVVDMVGGTSQGAYIGALFAKNPDDIDTLTEQIKRMAAEMSDWKEKLWDLTLPITSLFSGHRFNLGVRKSLGKIRIQDLVLDFFCVSSDLLAKKMAVHSTGLLWKYVRASMSLVTYLPPISDGSSLLADGGYTNLVPSDVMRARGARIVISVDVSKENNAEYYPYGIHLSGWWLLFNSLSPFTKTVKVPSMGDLNYMIAWVSATQYRNQSINCSNVHLTPPVGKYGTLEFDKMEEIVQKGYDYAKPLIDEWAKKHPEFVSKNRHASMESSNNLKTTNQQSKTK